MSTHEMTRAGIALFCVTCAVLGPACAPAPPCDSTDACAPTPLCDSTDTCNPAPQGDHSPQGRHLIGGNLKWLTVSTSGASGADDLAFDKLEVREAQILGRRGAAEVAGSGSALEGATLDGKAHAGDTEGDTGVPVQLRIARICPHARPPLDWAPAEGWTGPEGCDLPDGWTATQGEGEDEYEVLYRKADSDDPWSPLCDAGWNRAVPASGTWSPTDGGHADGDAQLTLACQDGVIAKCLNWGYKPWEHRDLHQACTRMARADYCASGEPHTVEGTLIGMTDKFHIRKDTAGLEAEASWTSDGEVLCLSKKRWSSLPLGGPRDCKRPMKDPRVNATAHYCEEMDLTGDLLRNTSNLVDVGLYLWTNGKDTYTTSRGFYERRWAVTPPDPEYDKMLAFAGTVYRHDLEEEMRKGTVPLVSYRGPSGDRFTTTQEPPPDYEKVALEGYIFPANSPNKGRAGLYTWRHKDTGDHLTSANREDWGPQACLDVDVLGACLPGSRHNRERDFLYVRLEGYIPTLDLR